MDDLQNKLAAMKDIHLPEPVSLYQVAPGWWLSALLGFIMIWVSYKLVASAVRKNRYRRNALKQLDEQCVEHTHLLDDYKLLSEINQLLKSVAIKAYPQQGCAALSGKQWQQFLAQTLMHHKKADPQVFELFDLLYQAKPSLDQAQRDLLINNTRLWLKNHAVLSSKQLAVKAVGLKEASDV